MKQSIRVIIAAVTLWGVACGGNEAEPPVVQAPAPEPEVPEEPAPPPEPDSAPVAVTEATLPVAEDFEAEMDTAVTAENYRAELDAVLAELDAP